MKIKLNNIIYLLVISILFLSVSCSTTKNEKQLAVKDNEERSIASLIFSDRNKACIDIITKIIEKEGSSVKVNSSLDINARIIQLSEQINFLRNGRQAQISAMDVKVNKMIAIMDSYFMNNTFDRPFREFAPIFRKVETGFIVVKKLQAINDQFKKLSKAHGPDVSMKSIIDSIQQKNVAQDLSKITSDLFKVDDKFFEQLSITDFIKRAEQEIDYHLIQMGNNYHEYNAFRTYLNEYIEKNRCGQKCKEELIKFRAKIGINSSDVKLQMNHYLNERIELTVDEVKDLVYANALSTLVKYKRDRNAELVRFVIEYISQATFADKFAQLPLVKRFPILNIWLDELRVRTLYFPDINRVIRSLEDIDGEVAINDQLGRIVEEINELLVSQNSSELLETFVRRSDKRAKEVWQLLLNYSEKNRPAFYTIMKNAEEAVPLKKRGALSLVYETPVVQIFSGLTIIAYATYASYEGYGAMTEAMALRDQYYPPIEEMLVNKNTDAANYAKLKAIIEKEESKKIMEVLARRSDVRANKLWQKLKKYAEIHDKEFLHEMMFADEIAKDKEPLPADFRSKEEIISDKFINIKNRIGDKVSQFSNTIDNTSNTNSTNTTNTTLNNNNLEVQIRKIDQTKYAEALLNSSKETKVNPEGVPVVIGSPADNAIENDVRNFVDVIKNSEASSQVDGQTKSDTDQAQTQYDDVLTLYFKALEEQKKRDAEKMSQNAQ